ncbi:MAG: tetratricopeptide repeat protein [Cryomorphaceae bacterium]|nr:MAG: tetratricopeptide repeat protein [Cryomorphaceae bacterium]
MRAILIITILLFSFNVQSQKKELRKIDKLVLESFFEEAKDALESSKSLILSSEDKYRAQYYFYDSKVSNELKMYENAISSLNNLLSINESVYPTKVEQEYKNLSIIISNGIVNGAVNDNKEGNFLDAAEKLIMAYNMDTEQYVDYLYFAAGSAVNGKDYEKSLKYYLELKNKGYTGIVDEFFVTNNETGQEEKVSQTEYDLLKSSKEYSNPRIGQTESRFPEIVKNIALIYVQQGQNELAEEAIKEARAIQPDDVSLLLNEADLYIRISNNSDNDDERLYYRNKFKSLMEMAIEMDPTNGILYYNLGVIYAEQGELELSKEKYQKAIELIPDYVDAYLNLVSIILEDEVAIVEEMNSLGNSKKDNLRYDELKNDRENLYRECVPLLEELLKVSPENIDALNTLKNIYGVLGENEAFMQVKAKMEDIQGN